MVKSNRKSKKGGKRVASKDAISEGNRPSNVAIPESETDLPSDNAIPELDAPKLDDTTPLEQVTVLTTLPVVPGWEAPEDSPDGYTECTIPKLLKLQIVDGYGLHRPLRRPSRIIYAILETPSRGRGMFALEDIEPGDLILSERPLLMRSPNLRGPGGMPSNLTPAQERLVVLESSNELLNLSVSRMTLSRREAYMSLANSHTQDGSGAALGIMRTNGFVISAKTLTEGGDEDEIYSVVAEQLSHINHSCSPNVTWNWDRASFGMELRAVRKIRKDEEMFVHYCVLDAPSAKRQDVLAPYGFRCSCASCSDPIASDRRRREIPSGPFAKAAPGSVSLKASLNQLRQIEEEGLEILSHYIHALRCTAKAYEKAGNLEKEREFRKKVYLHTLGLMGRARAMDVLCDGY